MKYNHNNDNNASRRAEEFDLPERKRPVKRPSAASSRAAGTRQAASASRSAASEQSRKYSHMSQQNSHSGESRQRRQSVSREQENVRTPQRRPASTEGQARAARRTATIFFESFIIVSICKQCW